jgi:hypothetical protein
MLPVKLKCGAKSGVDEGVEQGVDLFWGLLGCRVEPVGDDG